jgi:hypothetical protein
VFIRLDKQRGLDRFPQRLISQPELRVPVAPLRQHELDRIRSKRTPRPL